MSAARETRHFIHINGRWVHYRRFGEGPAVLVLHGSPQSSCAVAPFCRALAVEGHCAIAPDTPGNGLSTPLGGEPSSADYAEALSGFADALGLGRVGLYGFHTGAAIACVFAARFAARVSAVAFNGLSAWTEAERKALLAAYLPRFAPVWDGSHMTWAWARIEEQTVFFPWYESTPASRMVYDVPPPAALHQNAIDLLEAGDGYRAPYASAFNFRTDLWLPRVSCPTLIVAAARDPLRPHLTRPVFATRAVATFDDQAGLAATALAHLAAHPGDPPPPPPASGEDGDGLARGWQEGIAWTGRLAGAGRPLILLHGAGGSGRIFAPVIPLLDRQRPLLVPDLPGHGRSAATEDGVPSTIATTADSVAARLKAMGCDRPAIAGVGLGGQLAGHLVQTGQASAAGMLGPVTRDGTDPLDVAAPPLTPVWDGGHLLRAFRIARWERLFDPWYRRDRAHAMPQANLDPADIQGRAMDLLGAGDRWALALAAQRRDREPPPPSVSALADPAAWATPLRRFGV